VDVSHLQYLRATSKKVQKLHFYESNHQHPVSRLRPPPQEKPLNKPDYFAGRRIGRRIAIGATVLSTVFGGLLSLGALPKAVYAAGSPTLVVSTNLSVADASIAEGNSGTQTLSFAVTNAVSTTEPCVVYVTTLNGTAINTLSAAGPNDWVLPPPFTAADFSLKPLIIPAGAATTWPVNVIGDTIVEPLPTETFTVSLIAGAGQGTYGQDSWIPPCLGGTRLIATGTITNDDTAPVASRGIWSLTAPAPTLEGNTGTNTPAAFVLKTTETLTEPCGIAFNLTLGATGIIGSDYEFPLPPAGATPAALGTTGDVTKVTYYASTSTGFYLRFPKGTAAGSTFSIPINITGDPYYEADETIPALITSFNLVDGLGTLGCGYDAVGPFVATATIKNDDPIPSAEAGIFSLTGPAPTVEGDAGNTTAAFTLTTSKATTVNCGVAINVWNVTAAAGVDYDLSIPPAGSTPGAFFVPGDPSKVTYYPFNSIGYWLPPQRGRRNLQRLVYYLLFERWPRNRRLWIRPTRTSNLVGFGNHHRR
jgi:hypothetical protein